MLLVGMIFAYACGVLDLGLLECKACIKSLKNLYAKPFRIGLITIY